MPQPRAVDPRRRPWPSWPGGLHRRAAVLIAALLLAACDRGSSAQSPPAVVPAEGSAPSVARSERFELRRDAVRPGRAEATARSDRFLLIRE